MNDNKPTQPNGIEDASEVMAKLKKKQEKLEKDAESPKIKPQQADQTEDGSTKSR